MEVGAKKGGFGKMMSSVPRVTIFGVGFGKVGGMTNESDLKMEANGGSLARRLCCSSVAAPPRNAPFSHFRQGYGGLVAGLWGAGRSSFLAGPAKSFAAPASHIFDMASQWRRSRQFLPSRGELRRASQCVTAKTPEYVTLEGLKHRDSPQYVTKNKYVCLRLNSAGTG